MADAQRQKLIRRKLYVANFSGRECYALAKSAAFDLRLECAGHSRFAGIAQLGLDGEVCLIEIPLSRETIEMRDDLRVANLNRSRGAQVDVTPKPHILIGRRGIPIDPIDSQVVFGGGNGFHRDHVRAIVPQKVAYIELVRAIRARDIVRPGEFVAVEPAVGTIVDAAEMQPNVSGVRIICHAEFGSVPPRAVKRAVLRHWQHGEYFADWIRRARYRAQIFSEIWIRKRTIGDQSCNYRGRHGRRVPAFGAKCGDRNVLAVRVEFARRLEQPAVAKEDFLAGLAGIRADSRSNGQKGRDESQGSEKPQSEFRSG